MEYARVSSYLCQQIAYSTSFRNLQARRVIYFIVSLPHDSPFMSNHRIIPMCVYMCVCFSWTLTYKNVTQRDQSLRD